ncbi:hypothetical protein NLI96_g11530 [Meripilus lineatus]|uniref:Protein kinase domain-containing protein n=1 Tax=Meripilus lineatus TaxID=2056292 RepID=A0AAD5URL6_9APHY|nr:hypothetical protein NLI96_g11530 [Physisporinus lineatus]
MADPVTPPRTPHSRSGYPGAPTTPHSPQLPEGRRPSLGSTPVAKKESSARYGAEDPGSDAHYKRQENEFRRYIVGPIPKDILLSFLPKPNEPLPACPPCIGNLSREGTDEKKLYPHIHKQVNPYIRAGFELAITDNPKDARTKGSLHPDLMIYPENVVTQKDLVASAHLEHSEIYIEVKGAVNDDPFKDLITPKDLKTPDQNRQYHQFLKDGEEHVKTRGQIIAYAAHACETQHRHCYYSILICHHKARIIRWDRAGALVSESFDCSSAEGIEFLGDFIWRYTHASPFERGWDPTVLISSPEDIAAFGNACEKEADLKVWYDKDYVVTLLVWVPGDNEQSKGEFLEYLVSRPVVSPLSMAGRGTRGFWALSKKDGSIVFVKDTYRAINRDAAREGDTLETLLAKGVQNVPKLHAHGDVPDGNHGFQHTWTQHYVEKYYCGGNSPIVQYVHYRLVSKTVGLSLAHAPNTSRELLTSTQHAFQGPFRFNDRLCPNKLIFCALVTALYDAYTLCRLMHRDISVGNIIIDRVSKKGVLIDWEMAYKVDRDTGPRTPYRSGTWQFMAHELLRRPKTLHLPYHDIESFFWVVFYATALWFAPKMDKESVIDLIHDLFDYHRFNRREGVSTGGATKKVALQSDERVDDMYLPPTSILYTWLKKFRVLCFRLDTDVFDRRSVEETFKIFNEAWKTILEDESFTTENRFKRKKLTIDDRKPDAIPIATRQSGSFPPNADNIRSAISLPTHPFLEMDNLPRIEYPSTAPVLNTSLKRQHEPDEFELRYQDSGKRRELSNDDVEGPSGSYAQLQALIKNRLEHSATDDRGQEAPTNDSGGGSSRPKTRRTNGKGKGKGKARAP